MKLAEKLHITPQAISKWERGKSDPDKQYWVELSQILDIPRECFTGLYEVKSGENDDCIPAGMIAALSTFADALRVLKSDTLGGNNNDRDSDN